MQHIRQQTVNESSGAARSLEFLRCPAAGRTASSGTFFCQRSPPQERCDERATKRSARVGYHRLMAKPHSDDRLHHSLSEITRLLGRHRVLEALAHQQDSPRRDLVEQLQHRQNVAELGKRLRLMHAADMAHVLEGLPLDDRTTVWREVAAEQAGDVLEQSERTIFEESIRFPRSRSAT